MSKLKSIEEGAFSGLPALRHFKCAHNIHFDSFHPHAFNSREIKDNSSETNVDWPPIQNVRILLNAAFFDLFARKYLFPILSNFLRTLKKRYLVAKKSEKYGTLHMKRA